MKFIIYKILKIQLNIIIVPNSTSLYQLTPSMKKEKEKEEVLLCVLGVVLFFFSACIIFYMKGIFIDFHLICI